MLACTNRPVAVTVALTIFTQRIATMQCKNSHSCQATSKQLQELIINVCTCWRVPTYRDVLVQICKLYEPAWIYGSPNQILGDSPHQHL